MWGRKHRPQGPSRKSVLLAEALQRYESGLCRDCGQPAFLSFDMANTNMFKVRDDVVCVSCEALHYARDDVDPKDIYPGTKLHVEMKPPVRAHTH